MSLCADLEGQKILNIQILFNSYCKSTENMPSTSPPHSVNNYSTALEPPPPLDNFLDPRMLTHYLYNFRVIIDIFIQWHWWQVTPAKPQTGILSKPGRPTIWTATLPVSVTPTSGPPSRPSAHIRTPSFRSYQWIHVYVYYN